MAIINRRNAVLGWLTWTVGKRFAERKARSVVRAEDRRSKAALVMGALAAAGAVLFFWRRRDETDQPPAEP